MIVYVILEKGLEWDAAKTEECIHKTEINGSTLTELLEDWKKYRPPKIDEPMKLLIITL
jgi:hypothetical protein